MGCKSVEIKVGEARIAKFEEMYTKVRRAEELIKELKEIFESGINSEFKVDVVITDNGSEV